jgi:hypothetical protein
MGGRTGLAYNTASFSGAAVKSDAAAPLNSGLADMTLGSWVDGGFKEIDSTNLPGLYQYGVPEEATDNPGMYTITFFGGSNVRTAIVNLSILENDPDTASGAVVDIKKIVQAQR